MISLGHPVNDVWDYTPRQIQAYLYIAEKRHSEELATQLSLHRLAHHGDGETYKQQMAALEEGGF